MTAPICAHTFYLEKNYQNIKILFEIFELIYENELKMLNEIRGSLRSRVVDSNNNVLSDNDRASIELEDGTKIVVGDIAWIKNHKCLDTLVIVQNIYDGKQNSMENLKKRGNLFVGK